MQDLELLQMMAAIVLALLLALVTVTPDERRAVDDLIGLFAPVERSRFTSPAIRSADADHIGLRSDGWRAINGGTTLQVVRQNK